MKILKLYLRCCLYNGWAIFSIGLLVFTEIFCYYSKDTTRPATDLMGSKTSFMLGLAFALALLAIEVGGETFRTYRQLIRVTKRDKDQAMSEAKRIVADKKSQYCNKRGAKLFIKDN